MNVYAVRDIVRENVGRDKMAQHLLDYAMEQGLRRIEKAGNYYWMRAVKTWSAVVDQQGYFITTSTTGGLNIPNYKDTRILLVSDQTLTNPDWDEVFGPIDMEEAGLAFSDTSTGMPLIYSTDDDTVTSDLANPTGTTPPKILLYPPKPDKTYSMRLHYYQWTSLPTDVTSDDHEICLRWPEALIYAATAVGIETVLKDPQLASYWWMKFDNPANRADPGELTKIKRYNIERSMDSRIELRPLAGSLSGRQRTRWNSREIWI